MARWRCASIEANTWVDRLLAMPMVSQWDKYPNEAQDRVEIYCTLYEPLVRLWQYEGRVWDTTFVLDILLMYVEEGWGAEVWPGLCLGAANYGVSQQNTERVFWRAVQIAGCMLVVAGLVWSFWKWRRSQGTAF